MGWIFSLHALKPQRGLREAAGLDLGVAGAVTAVAEASETVEVAISPALTSFPPSNGRAMWIVLPAGMEREDMVEVGEERCRPAWIRRRDSGSIGASEEGGGSGIRLFSSSIVVVEGISREVAALMVSHGAMTAACA